MAREAMSDKQRRAATLFDGLEAAMPEARIELDAATPLELLVAVVLSAQATDKGVNRVTPALFARYRTAADYARAEQAEVEALIKSLGLFRTKAKNLVALGKALQAAHGGAVPTDREVLAELPGVGRKTAGVVSMHLGGSTAFPVDTHVARLAGRMGLTTKTRPDDVEADLRRLFPEPRWFKGHQLFIWHGRRTCHARAPGCERCAVAAHCPKRGVQRGPREPR